MSVRASGIKDVVVPFVVYNLPDRDCAAGASSGELSIANGGAALYKTEFIDPIRAILLDFPDIPVVLAIEPDSLANLVTNMGVSMCSHAAETYKTLIVYAIKQFALPNVSIYIDGGHSGWLGWPANLPGAAELCAKIWKDAGSPAQLRGLATNVAGYNGWSVATWYVPCTLYFPRDMYINLLFSQPRIHYPQPQLRREALHRGHNLRARRTGLVGHPPHR